MDSSTSRIPVSDQGGTSAKHHSGASPSTNPPAVSPSDISRGESSHKRRREDIDREIQIHPDYPLSKKLKTDDEHPLVDSIGNHLAEVDHNDQAGHSAPYTIFGEQVIEQAKNENTIAVIPSIKSAINALTQYLTWAVELERHRHITTVSRHRTVLLVADHDTDVDPFTTSLEDAMPNYVIGKLRETMDKPSAKSWAGLLQQDVIVISSSLLLDSLVRGCLAITQTHVLIILDAHNIQDQGTYSSAPIVQVMNDFYRVTDPMSRPRIFALTNSPPDELFHFDSTMLRLETILDAKVFGVSAEKREEVLALPDCPNEVIILYDKHHESSGSRLLKQLLRLNSTQTTFRKQFRASQLALNELGSCASDLIWRRALKEIDSIVKPSLREDDEDERSPMARIQHQIRELVKNWTFTMPNLDASSLGFNVTPKFLKLVQILKSCEPYGSRFRGIVFVQQDAIALVLVDLLRTIEDHVGFLRPYALFEHGPLATPHRQQQLFHSFATGSCNLLIATQSVEDLGIPRASIVIRFDMFESQVSHAYVRACTRGRESHLVHMVERGNETHRRMLSQITQLNADMLRWTEALGNSPQSSVPPPTLRETRSRYYPDSERSDEDTLMFIKDPVTNSRIYLQDATSALYKFASSLVNGDIGIHPGNKIFTFDNEIGEFGTQRAFTCTIVLPGTPVHGISGPSSISRPHARRAACYNACKELSDMGFLDYRFFPTATESTNDCDPADSLALPNPSDRKSSGSNLHLQKQPDFWENTHLLPATRLYPTIILADYSMTSELRRAPFLILTKQCLPDLANFNLFQSSVPTVISLQKAAPFRLDATRLHELHLYTVRVCRAILNKPYSSAVDAMAYFLAPLRNEWTSTNKAGSSTPDLPSVVDFIPWDQVALAARDYAVSLKVGRSEEVEHDIEDAVIQDRWVEFTRRYEAVKLRSDLSPLSKPLDSPREADYDSLVDFCKARRKGFEGLKDYNQAIVEVSKMPPLYNNLNPTARPIPEPARPPAKYLIPELCAKFTIPASTLRTASLLPSIMRKIDHFLLVKELNAKFFDHTISEDLLYTAICAPSAAVEHDYERLELLGDAFLKYFSTIYVFVTNPSDSEGTLHMLRQKIISNKALLESASRTGLPGYIQAKPFASKAWHPPGFRLGSCLVDINPCSTTTQVSADHPPPPLPRVDPTALGSSETLKRKKTRPKHPPNSQWLGDKAIADVAEAIIGAAYITGGRETALRTMKALQIPVAGIDQWSDFERKALVPSSKGAAKLRPGSIEAVESIIGHKITRPHLLVQALTHSSIQGFESTSYERLEFVGDAILDFMVIRHIFDRDQQLSPGGLTLLKSAMVSNSALAAVCVWSGLHEHLLYESYPLSVNIHEYVTKLRTKQTEEYKLAGREGRSPGQYWLDLEPPKALSDMIESIIGAIYISDNFSPVGAEALFDNVLKAFFDKHVTLKTLAHHPTKILFELLQAQGCHRFEILKDNDNNSTQCQVIVHDVVLSDAKAPTASVAAKNASLFALDALEGDATFMTRTCDCRANPKKRQKNGLEEILRDLEDDQVVGHV